MLSTLGLVCLIGSAFAAPQLHPKASGKESKEGSATTNIFRPGFGPDHDAANITQLCPSTTRNLYYTQDADEDDDSVEHMFADINMDFKKPAIILESTDYISSVSCSKSGLNVKFSSQEAYSYARNEWTHFSGESLKEDFILVSHTDGCETASGQGQRTFWLVDETKFDPQEKACAIKCEEIDVQEAAYGMKAKWGAFEKAKKSKKATKRDAGRGYYHGSATSNEARSIPPSRVVSDAELHNRGLGDIIDGAGDVIGDVVETGEDIADGARVAVNAVVSPKVSKTLHLNLAASQTASAADAPWSGVNAQKVLTYKEVDVYAADCGVTGRATVAGEISFSFTKMKITSGTFNINGNMRAALGVGLISEGLSKSLASKSFNIVQIPLSPLTIPEIVTLGPYINVKGSVDFSVEASGNVLATVSASLPNFAASIDLTDPSKNTQSGFHPEWTNHFEATGEITVSTTLAMPVEIGVGLSVPKIEGLNATVSVTNTPSLTAYGNFTNEAGPCQCGIGWGVYFKESTALDVIGVYSPTLQTWQSPDLASGCVADVAPASVCKTDTLANKKTESKSKIPSSSTTGVGDTCKADAGAGTCASTSDGCSGGTFYKGFCKGPSTVQCCVKTASSTATEEKSTADTHIGDKCTADAGGGTCADASSGASGCS